MTTTKTTTTRRTAAGLAAVAALAAALAVPATAASAAEAEGAQGWEDGAVLPNPSGSEFYAHPNADNGFACGYASGGLGQAHTIELTVAALDGEPVEGAAFAVEHTPGRGSGAEAHRVSLDSWAETRDPALEQARLDAIDAYAEADDAAYDALVGGTDAEYFAALGERSEVEAEYHAASHDLATHIAENAEIDSWTITTDAAGVATLTTVGCGGGTFTVTDAATGDTLTFDLRGYRDATADESFTGVERGKTEGETTPGGVATSLPEFTVSAEVTR